MKEKKYRITSKMGRREFLSHISIGAVGTAVAGKLSGGKSFTLANVKKVRLNERGDEIPQGRRP